MPRIYLVRTCCYWNPATQRWEVGKTGPLEEVLAFRSRLQSRGFCTMLTRHTKEVMKAALMQRIHVVDTLTYGRRS